MKRHIRALGMDPGTAPLIAAVWLSCAAGCRVPPPGPREAQQEPQETTVKEGQPPAQDNLRERLTPEQYRVTQQCGTEPAFTGKYHKHKADGVYSCVCCGKRLFASGTKYDSGSGWPSFWNPVTEAAVSEKRDVSHGMVRTETRCGGCGAHLGHVFSDGPDPTGLRYCINSAALDFTAADNAATAGSREKAPE